MPTSSPDFIPFIESVDKLAVEIAAHKAQLTIADRRSRWARTASMVGIVVGVVGIAVGLGGAVFGLAAQTTADDLADSRRETQVSACVQQNVTTERVRVALVQSLLAILPPGQEPTDAQKLIVDRYTTQVEQALPYRSCSEAGIKAYFDHPPADPAATQTSSTTTTR